MTHNEKSPPGSGLHSENKPWQAVFWFIKPESAGDDMQEYSNVSTQKQRVLYE